MTTENRKRMRLLSDADPKDRPSSNGTQDVSRAPKETSELGKEESRHVAVAQQPRSDVYYKNLYTHELDFRQMALEDPDFAAVLKGPRELDFKDPVAFVQLTRSTLKRDFGLDIELPADRLCPPVPNRHNYILWLKELLDSSSYDKPGGRLSGLDIGTGASCIYPLLGCTQRPWEFIATDLDKDSLVSAAKNVQRNGLEHRIRLVQRHRPTDPLIPLDELGVDSIDFVMTNPPFYESAEELARLARNKSRPPNSACTGAPVEMVCDGGEVGFVGRVLAESLALGPRVRWYSSMLGKVSSLEALVGRLRERGVDNYAVAEFVQGSRTRRWAVAWSLGPMRPGPAAARAMPPLPWNRRVLPPPVEVELCRLAVGSVGAVAGGLDGLMQSLDLLSWTWERQALRGVARTRHNVWCRMWRRRRTRGQGGKQTEPAQADSESDWELPVFGFEVSIVVAPGQATVSCRWREGHGEAIFVSVCGFLKGKLEFLAKGANAAS